MSKTLLRTVGTVTACALLGACATVTTGSRQFLNVDSDPSDATCVLTREGKVIGMVGPTPGQILVNKANAPIEVSCTKPGYLESKGTLASTFEGATLGNVILGGVIGVIADVQTGATSKYETTITVHLYRGEFEDAAARDSYFDRERQTLRGRQGSAPTTVAGADFESALRVLEQKRATARVKER